MSNNRIARQLAKKEKRNMEMVALQEDQIREQAAGVLKNRAAELSLKEYQTEIEHKRLVKINETLDEDIQILLAPEIEKAEKAMTEAARKAARSVTTSTLTDKEILAARVAWLKQYLVQCEGEYASHEALATERQRILNHEPLDAEERAVIERHWQENMLAMQSNEAAHAVTLDEMEALGIDPTKAAGPTPPQAINTGVIPPPEPPQAIEKAEK